jgi:hypothetical protein
MVTSRPRAKPSNDTKRHAATEHLFEVAYPRIETHLAKLSGHSQIVPHTFSSHELAFDAHIEFHPAMNLEGLKKAAPGRRQSRITAEGRRQKRPDLISLQA